MKKKTLSALVYIDSVVETLGHIEDSLYEKVKECSPPDGHVSDVQWAGASLHRHFHHLTTAINELKDALINAG